MPARVLTNRFVESRKPTPGKRTAYPDAEVRGLELRVTAEGRRVWTVRYRNAEGLQRRLTLGVFPSVDLAEARSRAKKALGAVSNDKDPAAERMAARAKAKAEPLKTVDDLAERYFEACARGEWKPKGKKKRAATLANERSIYRLHLKPTLGELKLEDISRATMKTALRAMIDRGIRTQTNRTQALARQMFAFAIAEERLSNNPATGFAPLSTEVPKTRTLADTELKALWAGLVAPSQLKDEDGEPVRLSRPMAIILQLAALLLQRRSEIAGMRSSELNMQQALWLIPGDRTKNGLPHLVPLPPGALTLIREADELALARNEAKARKDGETFNRRNDYPLFPGARDIAKPIRGDSVTRALAGVMSAVGIKGASTHDLRRTGATALTSERLRVSPFIRSKVLSHRADAGGGAAVSMIHYDSNEYVSEKRQALESWARLLVTIVSTPSVDPL